MVHIKKSLRKKKCSQENWGTEEWSQAPQKVSSVWSFRGVWSITSTVKLCSNPGEGVGLSYSCTCPLLGKGCPDTHSHTNWLSLCVCSQSCLTPCDSMDCSPPGSSVHGILQARILEWVALSFSRGSSWPRDRTHVSCVSWIASKFFTTKPSGKPLALLTSCSRSPTAGLQNRARMIEANAHWSQEQVTN